MNKDMTKCELPKIGEAYTLTGKVKTAVLSTDDPTKWVVEMEVDPTQTRQLADEETQKAAREGFHGKPE